jgi:hypothetical protein
MPRQAIGLQVKGIKELTSQLRAMKSACVSEQIAEMLGGAADLWRRAANALVRTNRWPHEVHDTAFIDARWPQSRRGKTKISVIFGFPKRGRARPYRPGYVEWGKREGKLLGMSLNTMFEFGTSKMAARPAYRPALQTQKSAMRGSVKARLADILIEAKARGAGVLTGGDNG